MAECNTVAYLKSIKFSQLTLAEKLKIKTNGRHSPNLTIKAAAASSSNGKQYTRKFNCSIYKKNNWITGCVETNALYCFPCLLFGGETTWTKTGINDLPHLQRSIKIHESSSKHVNNVVDLSYLGQVNVVTQLHTEFQVVIARHNEKVAKNRETLSKLVDLIKFCGNFELPLRGLDEAASSLNPGVFQGLVDLVSKFDSALQSHIESNEIFKGTSRTIQNDILDAIFQTCKQQIEYEIKCARFLAIMTDETTDISEKSQVVITFRYEKEGAAVERFWGFFNPVDLTSATLSNILLDELKPLIGSDPDKLIAQTYDGAAVLSGVNRGVQARIKEVYSKAYFLHCYAHQLDVIVEKAASQNARVRIFFASLAGIPSFFSKSSLRMSTLENITTNRRIPRPSSTPWNFKVQTVTMVYRLKEELVECFSQLASSHSTATVSAAIGLKRMMNDPEFMFWLKFFTKIMPHVENLYNQLQARCIDAVKVFDCVTTFSANILKVRDACDDIDIDEYGCISGRTYLEISAEAKAVCDVVIFQCQERFRFTGHMEASRLLDVNNFTLFSKQFPTAVLNNVTFLYPVLDKYKLKSELEVFYNRPDLGSFKSLPGLLQSLKSFNLTATFCEVTKLVTILITTPMTTAESERRFSTLKRIRTFLRNSMTNERLSALAMLSIENRLISETKDFNKKVINLFATSKKRRMDFIFK